MIRLSGLYEEAGPELPEVPQPTERVESAVADGLPVQTEATANVNEVQTYASRIVRYSLTRLALPGILVAGPGYLLASLGWNASWVMMLYVNLAMGLILVQSFMKLRRTSELRELFFISDMSLDPRSRRLRAKQVGMLMQAYRRAFPFDGGNGRLSQEGLLRLMGLVDPRYLERYNHSTVARWESGATRPTRDRLEVFGRALNLTTAEIEGMIRLSGLYEEAGPELPEVPQPTERVESAVADGLPVETEATANVNEVQTYASRIVRYSLTRLALPGILVAGSGYLLASLGWNASWVMMLYVNLAMGLILVQSFMKLRRTSMASTQWGTLAVPRYLLCLPWLSTCCCRLSPA